MNGGTYNSAKSTSSNAYKGDKLITPNNTLMHSPDSNHKFKEWNSKSDGTGYRITNNETILTSDTDVTFYAIWKFYKESTNGKIGDVPVRHKYKLTTNGNFTITHTADPLSHTCYIGCAIYNKSSGVGGGGLAHYINLTNKASGTDITGKLTYTYAGKIRISNLSNSSCTFKLNDIEMILPKTVGITNPKTGDKVASIEFVLDRSCTYWTWTLPNKFILEEI